MTAVLESETVPNRYQLKLNKEISMKTTHVETARLSVLASLTITLLALCGASLKAQNTELSRNFAYFTWSLSGLPSDIRASAQTTDSVGRTIAYYSASNGSNGLILLNGNGWQSLQIPYQLLSAQGFTNSVPPITGLNAGGLFVGSDQTAPPVHTLGFVWSGASLLPLAEPGALNTLPQAINLNGQIAGSYLSDQKSLQKGFILDPKTGFHDVLSPGGRYMVTKLTGINTQGDVVGTYANAGAGDTTDAGAFISTSDGRVFYLDSSHVYTESGAVAEMTPRNVLPTGINRSGEVVGIFNDGNYTRNFYYYNGTFRVLTGPPPSNCPNRLQYPQIDPSVWAPFRVSGIDDDGAIHGSADCRFFIGTAFSRPPTPWYAGKPSMQLTGPSAHGDSMNPGQVLQGDESITSLNGKYTFTYQADGNLVLYRNSDHISLWSSESYGTTIGVAIMQTDGNFVVYDRQGVVRYTSHTSKNPGSFLRVQDDGNVVVYTPSGSAPWSTHTVQH